jgi:hypothetical protein
MNIAVMQVGMRGTDSVSLIDTQAKATSFKTAPRPVDFVMQYLGSASKAGVATILAAGLGFMPITYADRFNGTQAVAECQALALPKGITVWLDVEGINPLHTTPQQLIKLINDWAATVQAAGYIAGLYVGSGCLLTSLELYDLKITRYWHSMSRVVDRNGQLAEPACGWCMHQCYSTQTLQGIEVDYNFVCKDNNGRLPTMAIA